jgi:hypothetical protein
MHEYNKKQERKIKKFIEKHRDCIKSDMSNNHYNFTYLETPTGIGMIDEIRCNNCGKIKDFTDLGSW